MRTFTCLFIAVAILLELGCTYVPPLEQATGSIPIQDIVERVKCEIADAFDERTDDPYFQWMRSWGVKVDLTLIANDQGGITPAGTYVEPFANGIEHIAGQTLTFPQSFSLGLGANYNAQAVRTETISFSLSLAEMKLWREGKLGESPEVVNKKCDPGGRADLAGGLGLNEWINATLLPVSLGDLQAGDHPSPTAAKSTSAVGGNPAPSPPKRLPSVSASSAAAAASAARAKVQLDATDKAVTTANDASTAAARAAEAARKSVILNIAFKRAINLYASKAKAQAKSVQQLQTQVAASYSGANDASDDAASLADRVKLNPSEETNENEIKALNDANSAKQNADSAETNALKAQAEAKAAQSNAKLAAKQPDPPLDSVAHAVQFIVTKTASIAPSWTLVRWHGPTGNLASVSGITTHTLNIALGPTNEQSRVLSNLVIQQLQLQPQMQ
jgi:hypothetical protein